MSAESVRDTTEAERDANVLHGIRDWRERHPDVTDPGITGDELDVLLRVAAERDALRHELCDSAESKGHHGDPRYVIRSCANCGHAPHGVGLICWENNCPCRITGGITS